MSLGFEFATATRIVFGAGTARQAGELAASLAAEAGLAPPARRALVTSGCAPDSDPARFCQPLLEALAAAGVQASLFAAPGEPTVDLIQAGLAQARREACGLVIGFGGGSAIDAGKAIAALLTNPGDLLDYLEVIGRGRPLAHAPQPFIAIPTTAGTGAEVTRNAVIGAPLPADPARQIKVSLRSPRMLPKIALVDPELTYSLPPHVTASSGLDALTQLIEPYVSNRANPLTDALCREGLGRAAGALRRVYADGRDPSGREDMALASLFGGLALANARLGAVHGFAGVLGGLYLAPHGAVCAALLPGVTAMNLRALQTRAPAHPALARYGEIARLLTGRPQAEAADLPAALRALTADLAIPGLGRCGAQPADFPAIIAAAQKASSMQGNPIALTEAELEQILAEAL